MRQRKTNSDSSQTKSDLMRLTAVINEEIKRLKGKWSFFYKDKKDKNTHIELLESLVAALNRQNLPENLTMVDLFNFKPLPGSYLTLNLLLQYEGDQRPNSFKRVSEKLGLTGEQRQILELPLLTDDLLICYGHIYQEGYVLSVGRKNTPALKLPSDKLTLSTDDVCLLCHGYSYRERYELSMGLKNTPVDMPNKYGKTLLMWACERRNTEIVTVLINAGADLNATYNNGMTALMHAINNWHTDIAIQLIEAGADVNIKDKDGMTALMRACSQGHTEIVALLIKNGAEVNATDNNGMTALMRACTQGHTKIVLLFIKKSIEVNIKDKDGMTALMHACTQGHTEVIVALLIKNGAEVNATDNNGMTALMHACSQRHTEIVALLIKKGAEVNATDDNGMSALMHACSQGHTEVVALLLQKSTDVNATDNNGMTAIMHTINNRNTDIILDLIDAGTVIDLSDEDGSALLIDMIKKGYTGIAAKLIEKGIEITHLTSTNIDTSKFNQNDTTAPVLSEDEELIAPLTGRYPIFLINCLEKSEYLRTIDIDGLAQVINSFSKMLLHFTAKSVNSLEPEQIARLDIVAHACFDAANSLCSKSGAPDVSVFDMPAMPTLQANATQTEKHHPATTSGCTLFANSSSITSLANPQNTDLNSDESLTNTHPAQ